jgi:protein translocase SecG subunit
MIIAVIQVIISITLVILILLQERSSGLSGLLGGDSVGYYQARRGLERIIFISTIVLSVVFIALAIVQLFA